MIGANMRNLLFAILLIKFVFCANLNLDDELKFSIDPSTIYRSTIASTGSNGRIIRKCCPFGQSYPALAGNHTCVASNKTTDELNAYETTKAFGFNLQPLKSKLCGGKPEIIIGDQDEEQLRISQQGYLLLTDKNSSEISKYNIYCLEQYANIIVARTCYEIDKVKVFPQEQELFTNTIIPVCMCISVPLLFATALIYLIVPKLRTVHGETLALYSICLGIAFILMAYDKFGSRLGFKGTQSGIHFFMLASFCWLLLMTVDMTYHLWSYYPSSNHFQRTILLRLTFYSFFGFGVPALIVATIHSNQVQAPVNTLKAIMIPLSVILLMNFLMCIPIYKYFSKNTPRCAIKEEVKQRAKSLIWILVIVAGCWMFELVSMTWTNLRLTLIMFPTLYALQGLVMVAVFILYPHYKQIIEEWWDERNYDRPENQFGDEQV